MSTPRNTGKRGGKALKNKEDTNPKDTEKVMDLDRTSLAIRAQPLVHDIIALRLREYYDEIAKQPVPDRFVELLKRLDARIASEGEK